MALQVTDTIKILVEDKRNYGVYELVDVTNRKTKQTRKEWMFQGYQGRFRDALLKCCELMLRQELESGEEKTVQQVLERLDAIKVELTRYAQFDDAQLKLELARSSDDQLETTEE